MKILIVGFGSIGRRHFNNLLALGENDILFYRTNKSTLDDEALSGHIVETELEAALTHRPDAVIVSNPTALHLDVAIPAALAGCHILLEKPISNTMDRVVEFQEAVEAGGGQVLVGYQYRFHPSLQRLKQELEAGAIGRPLSVRAHWGEYLPGWHPWEEYQGGYSARSDLGGGVILTLSHPLDYLRWLLGEIASLWSFSGKLSDLEIDVEDCAEVGLRFASGVIGSVHLNYVQQPPAHRLEIVGTSGTLAWDNASSLVSIYRARTGEWSTDHPQDGFKRNDLFLAETRHFLQVARREAEPLCSLVDGIQALRLSLAALDSQEQGWLIDMQVKE